ncbi:YbjN domain-containing protein [Deinococcus multiflagellatus]|uniref:YbjN domain-containing protein n=1 Tax=Deinococcus multiflagellatus TaxID=1656887 RepID=A0ABW1ZJA1_9DEIO|nr:YbjN domain-containing protein [Deinococcus multiflagellatus]MBZ9712332.1 YbjN domain-containing protein [Deinococcus multiflagellatus]
MTKKLLSAAFLLSALSGAALAGGAGAPTASQVQPATPAAMAAALRDAGYKVTLKPADPDSDPSMTVMAGDYEVTVWLSGCKANTCSRATASLSWDYSDDEDSLDTELVNDWNSNYYTQAYIYEGAYYLDSTMPIAGGYTKAAVKAWMAEYLGDAADFEMELP